MPPGLLYNSWMNARPLNIDLHCHSTVSDGALAPRDVAQRAHANGVDVWALTDHDEVGGLAEAASAAREVGMDFATGVEISVTWAGLTVHIVGLRFDPNNADLIEGLRKTRSGRAARAKRIGDRLADMGMPGAYEGALPFAGNPELISRTHFARFLVQQGYCVDMNEAFRLAVDEKLFAKNYMATFAVAAEAQKATCEPEKCEVGVNLKVNPPIPGRKMGTIDMYSKQTWLLEDGRWNLYQAP